MELTTEHEELKRSAIKFVDAEINPFVDQWEQDEIFPAHEVFKKLGDQGLLGITKPEKYGGAGLDYSYGAVLNEALATINCVVSQWQSGFKQICQLLRLQDLVLNMSAMSF